MERNIAKKAAIDDETKLKREKMATYKRRQRLRDKEKKKNEEEMEVDMETPEVTGQARSCVFRSREEKKRAVNKAKATLPSPPKRKAAVIAKLIESPRTRSSLQEKGIVRSAEEQKDVMVGKAVLKDIATAVAITKSKRSSDARAATSSSVAVICGEEVKAGRLKKHLASKIKLNRRRLTKSFVRRTKVLRNEGACWTYTKRKTRSDRVLEQHRKQAYEFWASPGISRPTGNKKDVARKRIARNIYSSHPKQILEKTQTEVYSDFCAKYLEVKIGQRTFESCKPYFVIAARKQDRNTCCCRAHVELRMLLSSCMAFRKTNATEEDLTSLPIYTHLNDAVNSTLCAKGEDSEYHKKSCIYRECAECGVEKFTLGPKERDESEIVQSAHWQRFEYVNIPTTSQDSTPKRRLQILTKETKPGDMFHYFQELLRSFPAHRFQAKWQHEQMKRLIENLPQGHVCCVHDYSENYTCQQQNQIQSMYFSQAQASIHVTIMHRHALAEIDGEESTEENPVIVTEHLFFISPDCKHDHHSVHRCREFVVDYLKQINYDVEIMHEWTDDCAAQYKSRHCMGDISYSNKDFGFITIRNFFETSHAKGPQDGAGANLKHKADIAVIQGQTVIQNAKDLYEYANANLEKPAPSRYQSECVQLKRRIFHYAETVDRNRPHRLFKDFTGVRTIHSVKSGPAGCTLQVRRLSCYCDNCLEGNYQDCLNSNHVDEWETRVLSHERQLGRDQRVTRSEIEEQIGGIKELVGVDTTVAIASGDAGEEYYLMKTLGGVEKLKKRSTDSWGSTYRAGVEVFRGYFYLLHQRQQFGRMYKLDTDKEAMVYAASIRFLCPELPLDEDYPGTFHVSEELHLDILSALKGF